MSEAASAGSPRARRASRQLLLALPYLSTSLWVAAQTALDRDVQEAQVPRRPGMAESGCVPAHHAATSLN